MLGKYAEGASLSQSSGVQISRNGGSCPSPSGRRWPEGPDEGAFPALTRRFAPPSSKGRGTFREQVSQIEDSVKPHQAYFADPRKNAVTDRAYSSAIRVFPQPVSSRRS